MKKAEKPLTRNARLQALVNEYLLGLANENTRKNHRADLRSLSTRLEGWNGREKSIELIQYVRELEKHLAPGSVRERVIRLKKFYQFLVHKGYRRDIPINIEYAPRAKDTRYPRSPTMDELKSLFENLDVRCFEGLRDATMISFMVFEAFRVCEVAAIRRHDIEDLGGSIQCTIRGKGGRVTNRLLWPQTEKILRHYLRCSKFKSGNAPLFYSIKNEGHSLSTRGIRKRVDMYFALAGVRKGLSCHSLRHAHGSFLMARGVPITAIQERLRHENLMTTFRYFSNIPSMFHQKHVNPHELLKLNIGK